MAGITFNTKWEGNGLDGLLAFLMAMEGKANRPTAVAMTRTARLAEAELKRRTPQHVNNPTAWTMRSTFVRPAKPDRLSVTLGFKDWSNTGTPAAEYLQPIAGGGIRGVKPFEQRLRSRGVLGASQFAIPTGIAPKLNKYGNLPGAEYQRILSRMKALRNIGSMQNATDSARSRRKQQELPYFVATVGGHRGIFTRRRGSRQPIPALWFIDQAPRYDVTFPARQIMEQTFAREWPGQFERAIDEELKYWARKGK